jgi:hypothetical protein
VGEFHWEEQPLNMPTPPEGSGAPHPNFSGSRHS